MSCIASFENWSDIFRTRSFTLCKNDCDFNDRSDSVTVLESILSSSTITLSVSCANKQGGCSLTSLPVLTSNNSSDFHSWEDKTIGRTEMANVEQTQKMIPFITCEISLGQYVCELVFGVNVFDLDFGVQIDSIE